MIVDLARNDLGRVCEYGSVQVPALFEVEAHPGLFHLVSTVTGRLRPGVDLADVVRATFPPASVTGAPKPRVMQAIEDLEPVRRGVYCGAIGWVDGDRGRAELAVAIRTFTIADGRTHLGVGGGIVADSQPDDEWVETELKAARLLAAAGAGRRSSIAGMIGRRDHLDERRALAARSRRRVAARSRPRGRRRRVRDAARLRRRAVRVDAAPRALARVGARGLGLVAPDADELRAAADAVLAANELTEARLRITVTGGPAPPGSRRAPVPPTVIVVAFELEPPSPTGSVMIVPWTRNEGGALAGLKTISYAENVRALAYVEERGASEAIFANTKGNLCEATGSNVFLVLDGACCTPPLSAGCLNGVTRQLLLELGARSASRSRSATCRSTRCATPTRRSCRRPCARCSRSPRSTVTRCRRSPARSPAVSPPPSPTSPAATSTPKFKREGQTNDSV